MSEGRTEQESSTSGGSLSTTHGTSVGVEASAGFSGFGFSASASVRADTSLSNTFGSHWEDSRSSTDSRNEEWSSQQTSGRSHESSNSQTNQRNREDSRSSTSSRTSDHRQDSSTSVGTDQSHQINTNIGREKIENWGQSSNKEVGTSRMDRRNQETAHQTNMEVSYNVGRSQDLEESWDIREGRQDSWTSELSLLTGRTNDREFGNSESHQKSRDRSQENSQSQGLSGKTGSSSGFSTGFDWGHTSGQTWTKERSYDIKMTVPPGYKTKLFQVVGHCAHFQVRTNSFKRIDDVAEWAKEKEERPQVNTIDENQESNSM